MCPVTARLTRGGGAPLGAGAAGGGKNEGGEMEHVRQSQQTVPETPSPEMLGASKPEARVRRRDFGMPRV